MSSDITNITRTGFVTLRAQPAQLRQIAGHRRGQAFGALVGIHRVPDQLDFIEQALFRKRFGHQHQRYFRGLQHIYGFLRAGSLHRQHQRGVEPEHAFGGKLAHIADIRFVAQGCRRIEAGRIDASQTVLEAKRVENFGDGTADRDDPCWIFDRDVAVAGVVHGDAGGEGNAPEQEQTAGGEWNEPATKSHGPGHLVKINLFCDVSRRR